MGYTHELLAINQTAFAEAQKKYNSFIKHAKNRVVSEMMMYESQQEVLRAEEKVKNTSVNITKTQADIISLETELDTKLHKAEEKIIDTSREITQVSQLLAQLNNCS
ncbi:conserved hypothetical protein [Xenorhabdus nematophila str. Anatoliense]|nr:conserved hypothetical protein [Xenorhabdus nematophila str. Anatoliense]